MGKLTDDDFYTNHQAANSLRVIIVGAGIAGLSAGLTLSQYGHSVTILKSSPLLGETGAGIQLAPNATRILRRFGVLGEVILHTSVLPGVSIRRYNSDEELKYSPMSLSSSNKYGAPMGVIHRGDLHRILLNAAGDNGCQISTSHTVIEVDSSPVPRVRVRVGNNSQCLWFTADIVIAADGIKSVCRKQMALAGGYASKDQPYPTGDAAYRLLIPREKVQHDSELLAMLDQDVAMRYMGPGGHIMAYPLKGNKLYNMVLIHPSKPTSHTEENVWTATGKRREMMSFYGSWSPAIRKWLSYAGEENEEDIPEWTLNTYPPLPRWVWGGVALIGDACHPMLPYVAQGAANGIEDAAVIATALNYTSNVQLALRVYETVRKERAEKIAASASDTSKSLHLPDGPEQEKRDRAILGSGQKERAGKSQVADKWQDQQWQDYMWGVDVMHQTLDKWAEIGAVAMSDSEHIISSL
ncbi:hypothetical protein COCMIDRAFT_103593 [Bipolaris oryzae ATCC 44560]|uniref:FAD-binding domain-containing protein n=1 Tax=Bipolaris oryzae ATCC 44560 TaxID=930090 RepID=W6ZFZ7_COCMI|nr:uncharacterized protein COCMIDRAFT_103593 [Bipolaris oryzae ATCC 44560]EUC42426.1 hypothetical protein COCMIDRAFT_103593 [Bipolaris oryzae ATCC 44560]